MGNGKAGAEIRRHICGQQRDWNGGGIRGDYRCFRHGIIQASIQGLFDRQLFNHRLDDQIAIRQLIKISLHIACGNFFSQTRMHKLWWI